MQFKRQKSFNIILDLDQTIIAGELLNDLETIRSDKDFNNLMNRLDSYSKEHGSKDFKASSRETYRIFCRPYLQEFLDALFANFNVAVWTAASPDYAQFIIDNFILTNKNRKLDFIYTRNDCKIMKDENGNTFLTKPLVKLFNSKENYNAQNTIILDDNFDVHKIQPNNCILAKPFEIVNKETDASGNVKYRKGTNGAYTNELGMSDTYLAFILPKLWHINKNIKN